MITAFKSSCRSPYPPATHAPRASGRETVAEHRQAAHGFRSGRLVLQHVPVLGEFAVLETNDVGSNPRPRTTVARKAAMGNDVIPLGEDYVIFVAKRAGEGANKIEQTIAARRDMGAMLGVAV